METAPILPPSQWPLWVESGRFESYTNGMLDTLFGALFGMLPPKVMAASIAVMLLLIAAIVWSITA